MTTPRQIINDAQYIPHQLSCSNCGNSVTVKEKLVYPRLECSGFKIMFKLIHRQGNAQVERDGICKFYRRCELGE